mmetsp:Transcript_53962/g.122980  ORF Transcript_53962/g.122980 Transcript_53962/m.122980 type:complete len:257 (-) Transcript_53962:218-988(-)
MGLHAQLSSAEILEQVWLAQQVLADEGNQDAKLRNVVFMGMGEPLDNYEAVHEALRGLTHQCLFGLSAKHITVSTVGASASKIRKLADDVPSVHLALSLHGATQELREALMRVSAVACPLSQLEEALDYHAAKTGRGAMVEYLLIEGVNDTDDAADALANFCERRVVAMAASQGASDSPASSGAFVNLIPYNPTIAGFESGYRTPSDERVMSFHSRLRKRGVSALVRWSSAQGRDANGACGQLALSVGNVRPVGAV